MRKFGIAVAVIAIIALGFAAWLVLIPGPTAFASGSTVALADYNGPNPTGVPKELAQAEPAHSAANISTHAADCVACHTAQVAASPLPAASPSICR